MDTPPPVFPTPSEQRFFFFCLILAIFLYAGRFLITGCRLIPSKLLKDDGFLSIHLCGDNLTLRLLFSSKSTKYRVMILGQILDVAVPPCHHDRGPPCFLSGFSLQWGTQFEAGMCFLPDKLARCWKWFLNNRFWLYGYCSHLLQKRWEFLYPRRHEKARKRRLPFHHCRKKKMNSA